MCNGSCSNWGCRQSVGRVRISLLLTIVFLLSGCGGGGSGGDAKPPAQLPQPPLIEDKDPVVEKEPVLNIRLALFVVDFPDNEERFPAAQDIEKDFEEGVVREYFDEMSYGQFTYEIDSFGPFTYQDTFTSLYPHHPVKVLSISTIDIPGFRADVYDSFVLVTFSDYEYEAAISIPAGYREFRVNGEVVNKEKRVVINPLFVGCRKRNCGVEPHEDKFREKDYFEQSHAFTRFQRIFVHEFIHGLGIWTHAGSRTNGSRFDYEAKVPNNKDNLKNEYGNFYDIMGSPKYSYNLNVGYRDLLGWLKPPRKTVVEGYGCFAPTVNPINSVDGTVAVEIVVPEKQDRYYLEARDFMDKWDHRAHLPESENVMRNNRRGIMVNKLLDTDGYPTTYLLDMSPSPNRTEAGYEGSPDIRDVVLKPGGEYDPPDLRLWDVTPQGGNSFSVKIMVKHPDGEPHESCADY